jgi:hypothetical protein
MTTMIWARDTRDCTCVSIRGLARTSTRLRIDADASADVCVFIGSRFVFRYLMLCCSTMYTYFCTQCVFCTGTVGFISSFTIVIQVLSLSRTERAVSFSRWSSTTNWVERLLHPVDREIVALNPGSTLNRTGQDAKE